MKKKYQKRQKYENVHHAREGRLPIQEAELRRKLQPLLSDSRGAGRDGEELPDQNIGAGGRSPGKEHDDGAET